VALASRRSLIGLVLALLVATGGMAWWRERQDSQMGAVLAAQAQAGDIQMLSSTTCVFCDRARRWMQLHQVRFSECFVERDAACAQRYQATGGRGTPTLLVRGQLQLGFSPQQVLAALPAKGA
jgi:glutaredoxin